MIKGLHHAGISVSNLDRSVEFYCTLFGMELIVKGDFGGEAMEKITRLTEARGYSAMLRAGEQHLELFEFANPVPQSATVSKRVCEHGISHFCIQVEDVDREYHRLSAAGVEFHCEPQLFGRMKATYARDPDGNVIELLEIPDFAGCV